MVLFPISFSYLIFKSSLRNGSLPGLSSACVRLGLCIKRFSSGFVCVQAGWHYVIVSIIYGKGKHFLVEDKIL